MPKRTVFSNLQWTQLKHDESYHKDIVLLPIAQRVQHMVLHYAKYTGYFLISVEAQDDQRFRKTLIDSFIIALATANALNQDLSREFAGASDADTLSEMGAVCAKSLRRPATDNLWLVHQFAHHNSQLAKACEGWDHLEPLPYRDMMKTANVSILRAVLAEASQREIDLSIAYETRIREVESFSIFDPFIQNK